MITKIVKPQRRVQELQKIQTICRSSNSVCFTTFPERYNDRVIETCSLCRQSAEDVDIDTIRTLSSYNIVVSCACAATHKNSTHGGSSCLQEYTCGNHEKPLILTIVTPLMSRVHSLLQASEMTFLDALSSLDRYNNRLFFLCTHHPSGSLPLAVWISSDGSLDTNNKSIAMLKSVLPKHAFGGKGPNDGPRLLMTDDDAPEKGALQNQWPDSTQLVCIFHFLQAMWRWLWDSKHEIKKDDRKYVVYAEHGLCRK